MVPNEMFKLDLNKVEKKLYDIYPILYQLDKRGISNILSKKDGFIQTCRYTIEDAQSVIDDYKGLSDQEFEKIKYLALYGLLQAFFVQQDAIKGLISFCLNEKIDFKKEYPALYGIREIRNITTGHPTNNGQLYYLISQPTLKKDKFYLVGHDAKDERNGRYIQVYPNLLYEQENGMLLLLKRLKEGLNRLLKESKKN